MPYYDNELPIEYHLPEVVKGPWTREAKQRALERDLLQVYMEYFEKAIKFRGWLPWRNFPIKEMQEYGQCLSEETVDIIEGFLGVEEYVGDYVEESLEMLRDHRSRRNMQLQWGAEEAKHGQAWEIVLKHSGQRTDEELETYLNKVRDYHWTLKDHPGMDTPLGVSAYAMVQERATFYNYQEVRLRIRQEYGLPEQVTPEEKQRGYEVGASEAFKVVGSDEVAHHGVFLKIVQAHLRYFPSMTFDVLTKVFEGFKMPSFHAIPNRRKFLRSMLRADFYIKPEQHEIKIHNPILKALGLENNDAFEQAVLLARKLPDNLGPDTVSLSRTGEWVVAYSPNGA
ncbi:MAG TPA: hypothetical protein PKE64_03655 [Anaerolineae bacterium]|nr:hypothetical protein [Anaerolineae bacterium]HMR63086.1 hypothetical protein [Anaerolineae bacterium]